MKKISRFITPVLLAALVIGLLIGNTTIIAEETTNRYTVFQFETYNNPGNYIRHQNGRGRIDAVINPYQDAQFKLVPGLADANGVSFQSVNYPGSYLRHRNGEIWLDSYDNSNLFAADATWFQRAGLADSNLTSFESYNYPGEYLRHQNSLLVRTAISSDLDKQDATFRPLIQNAGVTFYQDADYRGTAVTLDVGSYTLSQLNAAGIPNDWMSGLKVPDGYTVEVYQNDNFAGTRWTYTAGIAYVGADCNDKMSSVKISNTAYATSLPTHLLTGYWQNFNNGARCLRISDVPVTYDIIAIAFADATTTPGAVSFSIDSGLAAALGGYTEAQFIGDIQTVKARGQHVIISVGGQNGTISVSNSSSAANFANSIYSLMTKYGLEGVDIDLENGINATYMAQALRQLSSLAGSNLIITLAPQTIDMQSTGNGYFQLALSIKDILTIVNMQYYNSGSMLGYDGKVYYQGTEDFLTALATIQLENGLLPGQVGLGLPASTSAAGGGYVAPSIVNAALDCLTTGANAGSFKPPHTYPAIRGAMTWSINWDASNGYNFANTISPHLDTLPGGGTPNPTVTPTPTPEPTPTPTPGIYPEWKANTAYRVGDIVAYNGKNYKCIQAHTSLTGWEPPNVPALWQAI